MKILGVWFPAGSSDRQSASISINGKQFTINIESGYELHGFYSDLSISQRVGNIPRKLLLKDQSIFETRDNVSIDSWIEQSGDNLKSGAFLHKAESSLRWVITSIVLVIALGYAGIYWGLPWTSKVIARNIPDSVVHQISSSTLSFLDKFIFEPSELNLERQQELESHFIELLSLKGIKNQDNRNFSINFRKMGMPNAFALPSGEVVVTDEFISILDNQNEIDAVLFHEIGHVIHNHGLDQVVRSSILSFVIAMIAGDPSGLEELFVALPAFLLQSQYSRSHESEADKFALEIMAINGIDPIYFARALEKIDSKIDRSSESKSDVGNSDDKIKEQSSEDSVFDYISTHPITKNRILRAQKYSDQFQR